MRSVVKEFVIMQVEGLADHVEEVINFLEEMEGADDIIYALSNVKSAVETAVEDTKEILRVEA